MDKTRIRVVYIKNTLSLASVMISEALMDEARATEGMKALGDPEPLRFDERGNLLDLA